MIAQFAKTKSTRFPLKNNKHLPFDNFEKRSDLSYSTISSKNVKQTLAGFFSNILKPAVSNYLKDVKCPLYLFQAFFLRL